MIESKTLGSAVGIQRQGVIDRSDILSLPAVGNGVIAGKFKRGRMDKPFKVTAANYRALLGHDPANASYLAVEDLFKRGASSVMVLRTGNSFALSVVAAIARMWSTAPYPTIIDKDDAYNTIAKPLDVTLRRLLKETSFEGAYSGTTKPLDVKMRTLLLSANPVNSAYNSATKPLDVTRITPRPKDFYITIHDRDAYKSTTRPLNVTKKALLIEHWQNDNEAYQTTPKPLDITFIKGV